MGTTRNAAKQYWVAVKAMLVFTVVLGLAYPLVILGIGQGALPAQANGSVVSVGGEPVGSALIGQSFTDADGNPLREWFQGRPSAAGDGYDAAASSGSNLGPENPDLIAAIDERRAQIAEFNDVAQSEVPVDAVTASASGLDPHISAEYALLQADRVAEARGLDAHAVRQLVESRIQGRDAGFIGETTVNVLQLNIAVAEMGD